MLAAGVPVFFFAAALVVGRRSRPLAALAAAALVVVLNLWWFLPLIGVETPTESLPLLLEVPRQTVVMVVGHLAAVALLVFASGVLSPTKGSAAHMAHLAARRGDHLAAGEFWLQAGHQRRAYRAFLRAHEWARAAELARARNDFARAADLFARDGGSSLATAAQLYARVGDEEQATDSWQRYGQHAVKIGQPESAIDAFVRAGDERRAVHAVELALESRRLSPALAEPALRAARDARKLHLAARVAYACDRPREAGDLFLAADRPVEAAKMFELAGETLRAAEALRLAGQTDSAARLRAQQLAGTGQWELAASEFEDAGMVAEAAEALVHLGRWREAVDRFRRAGRLREAAELCRDNDDAEQAATLFTEIGDWGEAGAAWERVGDQAQAARCYERAGDFGRALELLAAAGMAGEQAALLARTGRVPEGFRILYDRGELRAAWELLSAHAGTYPELAEPLDQLALWLHSQGETAAAISAVQRATAGQRVTHALLPAYYTLAELFEQRGDLRAAELHWQRIIDLDYGFRDASRRFEAVSSRRSAEAAASIGGAPSAHPGEDDGDDTSTRYTIEQELGRGGMGIVYRARDNRLGRVVAIKVLDARQLNPEALRRFEREARAAAALSHPGIVHIYDFDRGFGSYYISMEHVDGPTIAKLGRDEPEFVRRHIAMLMHQVCDAVAYAHRRHVVHRDLKPSNMILADRRQVKILDFGIARRLDDHEITASGVTGTPFYMAPEQIVGEIPDERSDVYSLGVTFFQMATGTVPFASGNILRAHLEQEPPDPRALVPTLPEGVSRLILSCLAKKPEHRPRDGGALLAAIAELRAEGRR